MNRKLARIETILALEPIPGADLIETATIGGWKVVVKKGLHLVNDRVVYFEIDSLIPNRPWSSFLFKDKRELYRLKTIRLKGQISQGLIVGIYQIPELFGRAWQEGEDVTELLQIEKWEMVLPAQLAGKVKGNFPPFLHKTDEERLQNAKSVLDEITNAVIYIALKMDGTSMTCYKHEGVFGVCSRNLDLKEDGGDAYWAMAKALDLPTKLPEGFAIQGELVGPGLQGNKAGLAEKRLMVFNVWDIALQRYLHLDQMITFCANLGLETVPLIQVQKGGAQLMTKSGPIPFPTTVDGWLAFADAQTYQNGAPAEGIVVRAVTETYSPALRGRLSFKVISNRFLIASGE